MADPVRELARETGATEEQARLALSAADGDRAKARTSLSDLAKDFVAVKARFVGDYTGYHGLIFFIADLQKRKFERFSTLVGADPSAIRAEPRTPWNTFEESIFSARLGGNIATRLSQELQSYLKNKLSQDLTDEIFGILESGQTYDLSSILADEIGKGIADGRVGVDLSAERLSYLDVRPPEKKEEVPAARPDADTLDTPPPVLDDGGAAPEDSTPAREHDFVVKVEPILAPVSGKAAGKLEPGETALVKIVDKTDSARTIARLLMNAVPGGGGGEMEGMITGVEMDEFERVRVFFRLAPGITGVTSVSGELKVKMAGRAPSSPAPSINASSMGGEGLPAPIIFGGFLLGICLIIALAYFIFGGI